MPMRLKGTCRCGAISFSVDSHTPHPYQRCYCSICRKSAGGGGYAINIMGQAETLKVKGKRALGVWNAPIDGQKGSADRHHLGLLDPFSRPGAVSRRAAQAALERVEVGVEDRRDVERQRLREEEPADNGEPERPA